MREKWGRASVNTESLHEVVPREDRALSRAKGGGRFKDAILRMANPKHGEQAAPVCVGCGEPSDIGDNVAVVSKRL